MGEMSDGRSARRERNRNAVLDALVEMTTEGARDPSIDDIADRAGVSYRSVYRYFKDRNEMMDAATDRAIAWIHPLMLNAAASTSPEDPLDHRIDSLVDARTEVYNQVAELVRNAMVQSFSNRRISEAFTESRRLSREQIRERYAPELAQFDEAERELRVTAIDQVLSFHAMDYMLHERGHTREDCERYMRSGIRAALTLPALSTDE